MPAVGDPTEIVEFGTGHHVRLLRQIGDALVVGVEPFLFVDEVVAVEDGAALVAGQEHGDRDRR